MNELKHGRLSLETAAAKSGMSENTARKYRRSGQLPSQMKCEHTWRTREDPFAEVSAEIAAKLKSESGLSARTIFDDLQGRYPGRFSDGQLRSLQRWVKTWRATEGEDKEVFFAQEHFPGDLCASDFCHADRLGVRIAGQFYRHLLYHFVLTYSNWEFVKDCPSESLESLSEGLQAALWMLGGVLKRHRTDSLSAAVRNMGRKKEDRDEFTERYRALISHYRMDAEHTQPACPNENGDAEQSHNRFLNRIDQALMLRGSRDFASRQEYQRFLRGHYEAANMNRHLRLSQERAALRELPAQPYDASKRLTARVWPSSTIRVLNNTYSVPSRLIGERVSVTVRSETVEVRYAQRQVLQIPRLRGTGGSSIDFRHIVNWLVRKPGAFDHYVHQPALFPTSQFRIAYDRLVATAPVRGKKEYLLILQLAAKQGQSGVEEVLRALHASGQPVTKNAVEARISSNSVPHKMTDVRIAPVALCVYDSLLSGRSAVLSAHGASGEVHHG